MATIEVNGNVYETITPEDDAELQATVAKVSKAKREAMDEYLDSKDTDLSVGELYVEAAVRGKRIDELTPQDLTWLRELDAYMLTPDI